MKKKQPDGAGCKATLPDVKELLILWITEIRAETYASPAVLYNGELLSLLESKAMESF